MTLFEHVSVNYFKLHDSITVFINQAITEMILALDCQIFFSTAATKISTDDYFSLIYLLIIFTLYGPVYKGVL